MADTNHQEWAHEEVKRLIAARARQLGRDPNNEEIRSLIHAQADRLRNEGETAKAKAKALRTEIDMQLDGGVAGVEEADWPGRPLS